MNSNNEKWIAWQGIFKGIMQQPIDPLKAEDYTHAIFNRLQEKYPLEEVSVSSEAQPAKQKPRKCPKCGSMAYYNNKGISTKSGHPIKWENNKCSKCKYIEWVSDNYYSKLDKANALKSMSEDARKEEIDQEYIPLFDENGNQLN